MCGIAFCLSNIGISIIDIEKVLLRRGPDYFSHLNSGNIDYFGCVLHIQGDNLAQQPVVDARGNILLWNGEVFDGLKYDYRTHSDTIIIMNKLESLLESCNDHTKASFVLGQFLSTIHGPYAMIYYSKVLDTVFLSRDPFGRRSLLLIKDVNGQIVGACSTSFVQSNLGQLSDIEDNAKSCEEYATKCDSGDKWDFEEVTIVGIHCIRGISKYDVAIPISDIHTEPWPAQRLRLCRPYHSIQMSVCAMDQPVDASIALYDKLLDAVRKRITVLCHSHDEIMRARDTSLLLPRQAYKVGVLFSGGLDSVILAVLLHKCILEQEAVLNSQLQLDSEIVTPMRYAIDLINISFHQEGRQGGLPSPDRIAAIVAYGELKKLYPDREWRLIHVDIGEHERQLHSSHILQLIQPSSTHMDLNIGTAFWFAARGSGELIDYSAEEIARDYLNIKDENGRPLLRIGDGDAALSVGLPKWKQESVPNKKSNKSKEKEEEDEDIGGDRIKCSDAKCGRIAKPNCIVALCRRCCLRKQKGLLHSENMIEKTNVKTDKYCSVHKLYGNNKPDKSQEIDEELKDTVDSSYACVYSKAGTPYQSTVKALLIGIGADEQMAGYGRHRTSFIRRSKEKNLTSDELLQVQYNTLTDELNVDLQRLWQRNLGRDDRCISDHGREVWSPYLDETVVEYLQSLPLSLICDFNLPPGEGDKKILRDVGKLLGLENTAAFVKRAIQFGTRIAKLTNIQYHGSNRKGSGTDSV